MKKTALLSSLLLFSVSLYAKSFVQCPNNQCGLINNEGQWSIEPKYEYLSYNPDGLSKFMEKDQFGFVDANGKVIIRPQESNINRFTPNGLARFKKNNKWGVTDKKFDTIVPAIYDSMTDYADNGLAAVKKDGKWGFIDSKGRVVIALDYTYAAAFAPNGLAVVEKNGLYGYIDAVNKMVITPQFKRANTFSQNGLALVQKDEGLGFINAKGEIAIELQKTKMEPFTTNGLALIQKDGKYGYMDKTGKIIIPAVYENAQSFMPNGLAVVQKDGKYGIIDSRGAFKLKPEFTKIENNSDYDILGLKHEARGWEVYDITSGKIVATYKADDKGVKYEITNAKGEIIWPKNVQKEVIAKQPEKVVEKTISHESKPTSSKVNSVLVSQYGIATDTTTGLMWEDRIEMRDADVWSNAKIRCANLTLKGFDDWRLPNIYELSTLLDNTKSKDPYIIDGFSYVHSHYWASDTMPNLNYNIRSINTYNGEIKWSIAQLKHNIRCVRGKELTFDDMSRLKKSGKIHVSQENIDKITPNK